MRNCRKSRNSLLLSEIRITTLVVMLTLMLIEISAEATTNLLINGNFETGNLSGWTWTPTPYSDPAMNPTVVTFEAVVGQPGLCFRVNPGPNFSHIGYQAGGSLSQTINLVAGTDYAVSVGAAAMQNLNGMNPDAGRIRLYIGGSLLWDWDIGDIGAFMIERNSYSGTYTPGFTGLYDFKLLFTRTSKELAPVIYHYVDNLSVVIPEPATLLLFGLGGLALPRKRKT